MKLDPANKTLKNIHIAKKTVDSHGNKIYDEPEQKDKSPATTGSIPLTKKRSKDATSTIDDSLHNKVKHKFSLFNKSMYSASKFQFCSNPKEPRSEPDEQIKASSNYQKQDEDNLKEVFTRLRSERGDVKNPATN